MSLPISRISYIEMSHCPLCESEGTQIGQLSRGAYTFRKLQIPFPNSGKSNIPISKCCECGLIYKSFLPDPNDIRRIFDEYAVFAWKPNKYRYEKEKELIARFSGGANNLTKSSLIDIGSGSGSMLRALTDLADRRSAMDITKNDFCKNWVTDEYILSFIESKFQWSGREYDVVTAFDVLEHLYNPKSAFENISMLLKPGGILFAQTGNPAFACNDYGSWWYLNLFEHHMCWPEDTLRYVAKKYDFHLSYIGSSRNKDRECAPLWKKGMHMALYRMRYISLAQKMVLAMIGLDIRVIGNIFLKDHTTVVLRKK